uniref:Telomeric repeat-binding factor 2-interacting protein 1 n=1 Tax=Periophthalmus magnuspinnatus TaxID=409849 RepID=A0A3B4AIK2_9GOBI
MSKKRNRSLSISKRLFVSEEGEPLNFYLRPGPMKRELVPLIRAGGGLMCNFLKKGTILLKDPEERASLPKSTAHLYVSTRYIQDCIEKNERLNIEEYRLIPESPNLAKKKSKRRSAYTTEEDNAILSYVSKHKNEIGGNRLWQEMAKQQVTSHSWQSMKYHYRVQLVHKLSACKQADTENVCCVIVSLSNIDLAYLYLLHILQGSYISRIQLVNTLTSFFFPQSDSDLQCETPGPSTSIEAVKGSSNSVDPSPSNSENQEKDPATTQAEQNPQPTTTDTATTTAPATAHNDDSTSDPAISEVTTRGNPPTEQALSKAHLFIFESESQEPEEDSEVTTRDNPPTEQALSKAHLFIFESESQELEDVSQSLVGSSSSAAIPTNEPTNSPSLTQEQLEEDVQLLREFMKHTNQVRARYRDNKFSVDQSLLLASGDLFLAYEILQNPSSFSGPIWTRTDDQRLCSTDQEVRQDLLTKYGEEALAKRLQFLEIEG